MKVVSLLLSLLLAPSLFAATPSENAGADTPSAAENSSSLKPRESADSVSRSTAAPLRKGNDASKAPRRRMPASHAFTFM